MEFDDNETLCLRGSLILADPSLCDSGFARSVLLLTNHSLEEGAVGFIMNKPTGKSVGDLLSLEEFPELSAVPVLYGGPVSQEHLIFASFTWNEDSGELECVTHLSTSDAAHRHQEGYALRAFVGYAGWSSGQLEGELKQRAWITGRAEARLLDVETSDGMWRSLLRGMGPWFHLLSETPEDPSLN
jgi:putative transcriptional regulator